MQEPPSFGWWSWSRGSLSRKTELNMFQPLQLPLSNWWSIWLGAMSARTIRLSDNSSWRLFLGLQFCHPTNYRRVDQKEMALLKNGLGWWSFNSERNFQAYVGKVHAILERIWDLFIYALNVGKKKERVEGKEGSTSPQIWARRPNQWEKEGVKVLLAASLRWILELFVLILFSWKAKEEATGE